jgi:histidine ammonia-lyase
MDTYHISNIDLTFKEILSWNGLPKKLKISSLAEKAIIKCHTYLKAKTENSDIPYYGINTGFGALCDKKIAKNDLRALQKNLILSHCCGVGELVDSDIVKWMMLLKVISLSKGHSGSQLETIQLLIELYNNDVIPEVFQQGSLGASGDLAPLAHMSLAIIGEGHVIYKGRRRICGEVLTELNLKPIELDRKEGLALLNGTQFMLAHGIHVLIQADNLMKWAIAASALSIDAYNSRLEPFNSLIHKVRKQTGQKDIAASILNLLEGSAISTQAKSQVQDPYSFRCIPQVLGATLDGLRHVTDIVVNEINAVTDNPIIFPDEDLILSGGNFHGQELEVCI